VCAPREKDETMKALSGQLPLLCALALGSAVLGTPSVARADSTSPIGRWTTIDDSTHKPKSVVLIWEKNGVVYGMVESIVPEPGKPASPVCNRCDGELKGKPIKGMVIMWGFRKDDDEWSGGRILDPENGKVYRCYVRVVDGGRRLKVRGYVGLAMLGRTQHWLRAQ
jgi:uncharacterized protein (DUF2147 family)